MPETIVPKVTVVLYKKKLKTHSSLCLTSKTFEYIFKYYILMRFLAHYARKEEFHKMFYSTDTKSE